MGILGLGVSFRRAPVELLERLAFTDDDLTKAYRHALDLPGVEEAVVLSTCNRVEVYGSVSSYHAGFLALKRLLCETRGVAPEELADPLYAHWERDAADHLFAVAAGLDSMVLGETQIHAQVREALHRAEAEEAAGPMLTGVFHAASRAGRRVRQETSLGAAPDAFVALGTDLAEEALGDLGGRDVVVIGAGQMAALAVKHLHRRGVGPIRILNRSLEHARALAERTDAEHGDLDALPDALTHADLVVSATGAAGHVVTADAVAEAMAGRAGRTAGARRPRRAPRRRSALRGRARRRGVRHRRAPRAGRLALPRNRRRHRARARAGRRGGPPLGAASARRGARAGDQGAPRARRGRRSTPSCRACARGWPASTPTSVPRSRRSCAGSPRSSCTTRSWA